jgi:hypothetical protein
MLGQREGRRDVLKHLRKISLALLAAAVLSACETATDAAVVPLRDILHTMPSQEVIIVTEDSGVLPLRNPQEGRGKSFTQVDLATNHSVMIGFNEHYIVGYDLYDGDATEDGYAAGAVKTNYQIFRGRGAFDYALTHDYRIDGRAGWVETVCYYRHAVVYRLRPGVINYIPASLQPPRYDGSRVTSPPTPDTAELRRVLARFPIGALDIAVPDVVAVVQFAPDRMDQALSSNRCSFTNDFTILQRYDQ